MTTLNNFIEQIKNDGLARQNRFTVDIAAISGLPTVFKQLDKINLLCEQAVLPGIAVSTVPIRTFGENREVVYDRNFENITLTFLVDSKMTVKKLFDEWMSIIINPDTRLIAYYDDYVTTMIVKIQDLENNNTYECRLNEVYPKSIQVITLDNNSKDVMKLSVTFAYKNHVNNSSNAKLVSVNSIDTALYYNNFQEFQQRINDSEAYTRAIIALERQAIETDVGGVYA